MKQQDGKILLATALGEFGAKEIGVAAHSGAISQPTQLTLHAGLGCAMGVGFGGTCFSGAVSGVIGELAADSLYQSGNSGTSRNTAVTLGGLSGATTGLFTSVGTGVEDDKTGRNIFAGAAIGYNAAMNNATFKERPLKSDNPKMSKILSKIDLDVLDEKNMKLVHEQLFFDDAKGGNLGYFNDNQVRSDDPSLLNSYKTTLTGFDDALMREAVDNVGNKTMPYSLLGFDSCVGKFNCQDWAQMVRTEYNQLQIQKNLDIWNSMINLNRR